MEIFLKSKEYWTFVETSITGLENESALTEAQKKTLDDQRLKDLKEKNYLFQAINCVVLEIILKKDIAEDIWDAMKKECQGTTRVKRARLQALRKGFEILHMKEGESVNDYFSRTLSIAYKMHINGDKLEEVVVIEKILNSMTPKFDYVVCSSEESNDIDSLLIDEFQSSLLVHEQRMVSYVVEEQALKVTAHERTISSRKNQTIMNMVRNMMVKKGIPKTFWDESVNWSAHILNRIPTLSVKNITPQEAWRNVRPSVDHFRIFGCTTYAYVPNEKRIKLDDKSVKCVFIDVSEESKAYMLYTPITEKIIIS